MNFLLIAALIANIGIEQNLDQQLPLDLEFRNHAGEQVELGSYFNGRPVILSFYYTDCPSLCSLILDGLSKSLRAMEMTVGNEFDVISVSIDPAETPEIATKTRETYLRRYSRSREGWHFLVGDTDAIKTLATAAGWGFEYDTKSREYMHGSGIIVATPQGKISRYFFGIDHQSRDLENAVRAASDEKIGGLAHAIILTCFDYDPETGKYGFAIKKTLRVAGVATAAGLFIFVAMSLRREKRAVA